MKPADVLVALAVLGLAAQVAQTIRRGGPHAPSPKESVPERRRRLRGAVAGLGIALGGPIGAMAALGLVYLPLVRLVSPPRELAPGITDGSLGPAESVGAAVVAALGVCGVAAWIGASCVGPRRRGALRGVGLVTLAALAAAATFVSPLQPLVDVPLPLATLGAALGTLVAGGAALLAWPERPAR